MQVNDYVWIEKYRPKTIDETILPAETKQELNDFLQNGSIPNLLFVGSSGTGKTTCAYALAEQLGYDVLFVNASNEGRSIDMLRGIITDFASSMSLYANRKLVILDEFDGSSGIVQDALRSFIELYSATTSFILTANIKSKLSSAILSRFSEVNFTISSEQKGKVIVSFAKRVMEILDKENITYEKPAVAELIKRYFPDFRRTLNELQRYSSGGQFTLEKLKNLDMDISGLIKLVKDKNYTDTIEAIEKMSSVDITLIANELYTHRNQYAKSNEVPVVVKLLSDYLDKASRTTSPKITCLALLADLMVSLD